MSTFLSNYRCVFDYVSCVLHHLTDYIDSENIRITFFCEDMHVGDTKCSVQTVKEA